MKQTFVSAPSPSCLLNKFDFLMLSLQEAVTCISGFDEVISDMPLPPMTGLKERGNEHYESSTAGGRWGGCRCRENN